MWFTGRGRRPSAKQAARRLIILKLVVVYALMTAPTGSTTEWLESWTPDQWADFASAEEVKRDQYWGRARALGLWSEMSPWEREYAKATIVTLTAQERIAAAWRREAAQVLMWALGLLPGLPPYGTSASPDVLDEVNVESASTFVRSARLRPYGEIQKARDVAELWHWRSRRRLLTEEGPALDPDPRLRATAPKSFYDIVRNTAKWAQEDGRLELVADEDFAVNGKPYRDLQPDEWALVRSITVERHFSLNWLCGYAPGNRWDETPTDTWEA